MTMLAETPTVANRTPPEAIAQVKFHASLNVSDLKRSVAFYAALFGLAPVKHYVDYAKFELNSPPLVLSLKPKRACTGGPLNHLGLRLTSVQNLEAIVQRLASVNARVGRQNDVKCCYAEQTKLWITDPDGTLWEVYVFHNDVEDWGEKHNKRKLWTAPLKAFGLRGVVSRWWNNAFGTRHEQDMSAVEVDDSPIPADACRLPNEP